MANGHRPLSPHLQAYRFAWPMALSISHRITGVGLAAGTLLLAAWIVCAALGPDAYGAITWFLSSWLGLLMLFGWTFALFYHLFNGIRHMLWDTGWGFELPVAFATGMVVAGSAVTVTVIVWVVAATAMWG